jgi:pimeloyl-ACP methyl ester carboxylesterase
MAQSQPRGSAKDAIQMLSQEPVTTAGFPQGVSRLTFRSAADGAEDWALAWPPESGDSWAVTIHGHGSHGDQLYVRGDVRRDLLPRLRDRGLGVLTPNVRDNGWMGPRSADDLHGLLDFLRREYGARRFYFIGGSMGGGCNLTYAVLYPEDVAGLAALCPASDLASFYRQCMRDIAAGSLLTKLFREVTEAIRANYGGTPDNFPELFRRHSAQANVDRLTMPVYVAHGDVDASVPVEQSRALAALCRDKANFRYHEMAGGDHESPLEPQILEEGIEWMLGPEES